MFNRPAFAGQPLWRHLRRLCIALVASVLCVAPAWAEAEKSGFAAEIKAQNEHHLRAWDKPRDGRAPATIKRDWEDKVVKREWTLSEGRLTVSITLKKEGPPDGLLFQKPVLKLSVDGRQVIEIEGAESFPDNPVFVAQIAEMDPANPYAEVVLSVYTGGAHCCSATRVLTSSPDGKVWKAIDVGMFDGGPLEARDLDRDGRYEFAMRDNAFLYTFGCYACSTAPLHILRVDKGQIVDVSGNPAFRNRQVESLRHIIDWVAEDTDRNGFLAGYVGQKILLGEGREAWALMLKHYDKKSDWGLDWCKVKRDEKGECPPGQLEMLNYPQALERFLKEAGYDVKK